MFNPRTFNWGRAIKVELNVTPVKNVIMFSPHNTTWGGGDKILHRPLLTEMGICSSYNIKSMMMSRVSICIGHNYFRIALIV